MGAAWALPTAPQRGPSMAGRCTMMGGDMGSLLLPRGQVRRTAKWGPPLGSPCCPPRRPPRHPLALPTGRSRRRSCYGEWAVPRPRALTSPHIWRSLAGKGAGWNGGWGDPPTAPSTRLWRKGGMGMACHDRCCRPCRQCLPVGACTGSRRFRLRLLEQGHGGGVCPTGASRGTRRGPHHTMAAPTGRRRRCLCPHRHPLIRRSHHRRRHTRLPRGFARKVGAPVCPPRPPTTCTTEAAAAGAWQWIRWITRRAPSTQATAAVRLPRTKIPATALMPMGDGHGDTGGRPLDPMNIAPLIAAADVRATARAAALRWARPSRAAGVADLTMRKIALTGGGQASRTSRSKALAAVASVEVVAAVVLAAAQVVTSAAAR